PPGKETVVSSVSSSALPRQFSVNRLVMFSYAAGVTVFGMARKSTEAVQNSRPSQNVDAEVRPLRQLFHQTLISIVRAISQAGKVAGSILRQEFRESFREIAKVSLRRVR